MTYLALSVPTTTGLFTLLGTLIGAIITGTLAIVVEILRRRWQRQETKEIAAHEKRKAAIEERKTLYPQFLSKGIELESYANSELFRLNPKILAYETASGKKASDLSLAEAFSAMWPGIAGSLREFETLLVKVGLVANETIQKLAEEYFHYLIQMLILTSVGEDYVTEAKHGDDDGEGPYKLLLAAMQSELQEIAKISLIE